MAARQAVAVFGGIIIVSSCSRAVRTTSPAPGQGTTAPTASSTPGGAAGGNAGRRQPIPRDSLAKLRAAYVARVMQQIAGRESQPAEQVFQNIQVLKGITAAELVHK